MEFEELTKKITRCANTVHRKLGFGFRASIYESSLLIELKKSGLKAESQVPIDVKYKGKCVGTFDADILVEDSTVIKIKSASNMAPSEEAQFWRYLKATNTASGLFLNFSEHGVNIRLKSPNISATPKRA